ncbi:hypothetical protein ABFS82_13G108100 [Erythranthe guttata]|uniref:Defensin-like protein n=1 Tax=Erythranthe guttata TaxID=4155 RepID=A0A022QJ52_ERYGU|nr:PREDICTED: uncharacterized protein LOC105968466 [Erythranthe guttata]EYU27961.1 hypothetical protein MIMGU_mgv1a015869mg [Erythranthe guttata]|eukprot:XP_012848554.1 PREDICTED: uncharacterized protein LOC105968466 [Erythranthe guttata]
MITSPWAPPCNSKCVNKYASLMQIPWRVFCKKGCDADGDTWDECIGECDEICYKDPVLKDQQWSAYIDRSPGSAAYSEECFRACISGCGYKFDIPLEKVSQVHSRPPKDPVEEKPHAPVGESSSKISNVVKPPPGEIPTTSA